MKQVGMLRKYWGDVDKPVSKDQIFAILENYLYFHDDTKSIFLWKEEIYTKPWHLLVYHKWLLI
jgi:hypothetical protein